VSSSDSPAPYLRNQLVSEWPPELRADVSPMPQCTQPNWLESRFFPSRHPLSSVEVYIGGRGAQFPVLHYDGCHTHAFLMQLHGDKEYIVFSPEQTAFMYPRGGLEMNKSRIDDVLAPDLAAFPLFEQAERAVSASPGGDALRPRRLVAYSSDLEPVGDGLDQRPEPCEQRSVSG
jgi:hypothetical protein